MSLMSLKGVLVEMCLASRMEGAVHALALSRARVLELLFIACGVAQGLWACCAGAIL
jgi:hypothetical protein